MENSDVLADERVTPGARLRQAREAAGISPREMADRLNWLPAHVTAIEENRFDSLRNAAFVRGYLRAYAKALGLDEDELVAQYAAMVPEPSAQPRQTVPSSGGVVQGQKTGWSVAAGIVIAIAIIAAISWQQRQPAEAVRPTASTQQAGQAARPAAAAAEADAATADASASAAAVTDSAAVESAQVDTATEESAAVDTSAVDTATEESAAVDTAPAEAAPEESAAVDTAAVESAAEPVGPVSVAGPGDSAVVPVGDAILEFSFSGDCWLEVRDGDEQLIYADLHRAGERLGLDGKPPFNVLAGNAAAVTLSFRGDPVPVRTRPGRDTARFTVGEP